MGQILERYSCTQKCWGIGAIAGVLAFIIVIAVLGCGFFWALVAGIAVALGLGWILPRFLCSEDAAVDVAPPAPAAPTPKPAAPVAPAPAAPAPAPVAEKPVESKPAEKTAEKPAAAAPTEGGSRPAVLDGPRGGVADDLKRIKGVGPKLEQVCNGLGFYHFDQIAAWSADEVAWVDQNLTGFKGRVTRDNWVAQAKILAAGGETEFSKKAGKGKEN